MKDIISKIEDQYQAGLVAGYEEGKHEWQALLDRTDISRKQKLKILREERKRLNREMETGTYATLKKKLERLKQYNPVLEEIQSWYEGAAPMLGRPSGSQLADFKNSIRSGTLFRYDDIKRVNEENLLRRDTSLLEVLNEAHSFVVEHNWAGAFAGASDFESEAFRLPFDICCFEFVISKHRVLAIATHTSDDHISDILMKPFVQVSDGWFEGDYTYRYAGSNWTPERETENPDAYTSMVALIGSQIKAISVALDAEVATTEIVRQPHKLVKRRIREGKLPPSDYHIVVLSRKSRAPEIIMSSDESRVGKIRLHFRRGHWRHFEAHKTWIKWMLVGNPDLGFIDKHYRL